MNRVLNFLTGSRVIAVYLIITTILLGLHAFAGVSLPHSHVFIPAFGGVAMELISGRTTAPGATVTALTPVTGDSFTVRNSNMAKRALLLDAWANNQVAGVLEIKSPKLHDNVRAFRARVTTADTFPLLIEDAPQILYPQDVITPSLSGSAVGGQIESAGFLFYYEDLAGEAARLITPDVLKKRIVNEFEVEIAITPGATGDYTGAAAINASFDTFIANTDYAIIGAMVDAKCTSVAVRGPDTGNLRVGIPGAVTLRDLMKRWFLDLSYNTGLPTIPVFNSANKAGTLVDVQQNQAGGAVNVTLVLAQLGA